MKTKIDEILEQRLPLKKLVFGVYDNKGGYYKSTFMTLTKGEALRAWTDIAQEKNNEIGMHPADFSLYMLGDFDQRDGIYYNLEKADNLGTALEYIPQKQEPVLQEIVKE